MSQLTALLVLVCTPPDIVRYYVNTLDYFDIYGSYTIIV